MRTALNAVPPRFHLQDFLLKYLGATVSRAMHSMLLVLAHEQ